MNKAQILYHAENKSPLIAKELWEEASAMESAGFLVGTSPAANADKILYRGSNLSNDEIETIKIYSN